MHWPPAFKGAIRNPPYSLQGRLLCSQQLTAKQVLILRRSLGMVGLSLAQRLNHSCKSPRKQVRCLHAIAKRPTTLTPSMSPKLGVQSTHQELH